LVLAQSCNGVVPPRATCAAVVNFQPTVSGSHDALLTITATNVVGQLQPVHVALTGVSAVMAPGVVTTSNNPQVAQYTITPPFPANVTVNFGQTTNYNLNTWSQPADGTDALTMLVAGMQLTTTYHMQATVAFANGVTVTDVDHTFTTGRYPESVNLPEISAATVNGASPAPGIEMLDGTYGTGMKATATDLSGNLIWAYDYIPPAEWQTIPHPVKLLPNGHMWVTLGYPSQDALSGPHSEITVESQEIDLAGNVIKQITLAQLNTALASAGFNLPTLLDMHHDSVVLPNGHCILITNALVPYTNLVGYEGQTINVLGDIVVDLDENLNPVWVWSEFDHLDVNRHPMSFPDWTHTNAVLYSPDDGNLILSIRHQNWVVKINYANGTGDGSILWHLGYQGDFTLVNGVDPTDWQYAQHKPNFVGAATAGVFNLVLFDNGNDRQYPAGVTCKSLKMTLCPYSTVPEYQIDETNMTATIVWHDKFNNGGMYSSWGGNAEQLSNGNFEAVFSDEGIGTDVYEIVPSTYEQIWQLTTPKMNLYRSYRLGSLYPGVTWANLQ
jgi:hypothetical protein